MDEEEEEEEFLMRIFPEFSTEEGDSPMTGAVIM